MTLPVIHRVRTLDLAFKRWRWPFADERRAEIAAHFAAKQREKPIWNGRILLGRNPKFTAERFSASYFDADFASFLAWRLGLSGRNGIQRLRDGRAALRRRRFSP